MRSVRGGGDQGGEVGLATQNSSRGADRKVNTIVHRGKRGTEENLKHMISVFELLQLCANLMTKAEWSGA